MNDETTSAETRPNPPSAARQPILPTTPQPLWHWVKKFLGCNPFYLASAALLLFGICRVSLYADFLPEETAQLTFNFTALQCYELLLVFTAMLLARKLIWYDAKLLVSVENLLLLVPFMLISQAALIDLELVWLFCGAAAAFTLARSGLAQRGVAALRFPPRLAWIGVAVLAVNSAWPVIYRMLHEDKVGTKLESGAAYGMHVAGWWVLLPALLALANLLPRPREDGGSPVQGRRFPVGLFTLWMLGTAAHLYALGYVYDFDLRREWLAPALWVLAWTLHLRLPDYVVSFAFLTRKLTLALPLPVALFAASETGSNVGFVLNMLNLVAFVGLLWTERGHRLALHLSMLSFAALVATLPAPLVQFITSQFDRVDLIGLAFLSYVIAAAWLSRNPKAAIAGAIAAAVAGGVLRDPAGDVWHWAVQSGLVFFLLHSLRWWDHEHEGAVLVRVLAAGCWLVHSVVWVRVEAVVWPPLAVAGIVLCCCWLRGFMARSWTPLVVPVTAALVALCGPLNFLLLKLQTAPSGVLAIAASFVLFGCGTAAALTKHRWHNASGAAKP